MEWQIGDRMMVMTSDNSGGIGEKPLDEVNVPYEMVAYFAFRVAVMDCLSAGAVPISVIVHNFCGDDAWTKLVAGVRQGLTEIGADGAAVTGSTESNMVMQQSAVAVTIMGERVRDFSMLDHEQLEWSLAGKPLVGMEVVERAADVAPLSQGRVQLEDPQVALIWPVGSKGVAAEWAKLCDQLGIDAEMPDFGVNVMKSGGPATCWIVGRKRGVE
ncbi:hypothetical protein KP77_29740 [Jeotgalibacillus alimentarius]|uniref:Uncharacterized protein n=2 Tax=Jeotgalibacillus alimentarius TaxID=135826 RepID=A0A0C2R170_9BACL|nr:hypothetical protein KP77_29740 [Jeotgalibacillus alimentarius]